LGLPAQRFALPEPALPPEGNPHPMTPELAGLQAAFLKTLSTHFDASFLRERR
jgi:hypothetical protein